MSAYDQAETVFKQENKKLKLIIAITLLVSTVLTISNFIGRSYFIYKGKSIFEERLLSVEICKLAIESIAAGDPNPYVVSDAIIDILEKDPFDVPIDKILKLESIERDHCRVILKSGQELISFKIGLEGSLLYPFNYKLKQLDETRIQENM
ncbi:MAG: hypothetical protein N4A33_02965 [Bacteriovoracaceae bacterium]|jgi:hypothetical protein|nr:hypothetical protein [Bacteriovoracaceae bacterium]